MREELKKIKYIMLDLDGTVYLENELIGDMKNTLNILRNSGKKLIYLTNNSSRSRADCVKKLSDLCIFEDGDEVYTSVLATASYLKDVKKDKGVFVCATRSVKKEFEDLGIVTTDDLYAKTAVLTFDKELDYKKICDFNEVLVHGAHYVLTHPDDTCPTPGVFLPDIGAFKEMFKVSSGRSPDIIVGKPNTVMGDAIIKRYGGDRSEYLMVGDRLYTDIRFGINNSFKSLLVLSGETSLNDLKSTADKPTFILNDLNEIVKYL